MVDADFKKNCRVAIRQRYTLKKCAIAINFSEKLIENLLKKDLPMLLQKMGQMTSQ